MLSKLIRVAAVKVECQILHARPPFKLFHSSALLEKGRHGGATAFEQSPRGLSKKQKQRKRKANQAKDVIEKASAKGKMKANEEVRRKNVHSPEFLSKFQNTEQIIGPLMDELAKPFPSLESVIAQALKGEIIMGIDEAQSVFEEFKSESPKAIEAPIDIFNIVNPSRNDGPSVDESKLFNAANLLLASKQRNVAKLGNEMVSLLKSSGYKLPCKLYYDRMLNATGNSLFEQADQIFDEMLKDGVEPDIHAWSALVVNKAKSKDIAAAKQIMKRNSDIGLEPTMQMHTAILEYLVEDRQFEEAEDYWIVMHSAGVPLDLDSFHIMLKQCTQTNQSERAFFYFDELRSIKLNPTVKTCELLIRASAEAPFWESGFQNTILDAMTIMEGLELKPEASTYDTIIHAFGKAGDAVAAEFYYWEMVRKGFTPSPKTYCILMYALSRACSVGAREYGYRGRYVRRPKRQLTQEEKDYREIGPERMAQYEFSGLFGNERKERGSRQFTDVEDALDDEYERKQVMNQIKSEANRMRKLREHTMDVTMKLAQREDNEQQQQLIGFTKSSSNAGKPSFISDKEITRMLKRIEKNSSVEELDFLLDTLDDDFFDKKSPNLDLLDTLCLKLKPNDFTDFDGYLNQVPSHMFDNNEQEYADEDFEAIDDVPALVHKGRVKKNYAFNKSKPRSQLELLDNDIDEDADDNEGEVDEFDDLKGDDEFRAGDDGPRFSKYIDRYGGEEEGDYFDDGDDDDEPVVEYASLFRKVKPTLAPGLAEVLHNMSSTFEFKDEFIGKIPISNPIGLGGEIVRDRERLAQSPALMLLDEKPVKNNSKELSIPDPTTPEGASEIAARIADNEWDAVEFGRAPLPDYSDRLSKRRRLFKKRLSLVWQEVKNRGFTEQEMEKFGMYDAYLAVHSECKHRHQAYAAKRLFAEKGIMETKNTYRHLIRMELRFFPQNAPRSIEKALAWKAEAEAKNISIDDYSYGMLIEVIALRGDIIQAVHLLEETATKGIKVPEKNMKQLRKKLEGLKMTHPDMPVDPNQWVKDVRKMQKEPNTRSVNRVLQSIRSATYV